MKCTSESSKRLDNHSLDGQEILVSYDFSFRFTDNLILKEIYARNKLRKLGHKHLFKRLLRNVTKNTVCTFVKGLYRQTDGCGIGKPLPPVLANSFLMKFKEEVVHPCNPVFYDRYVDDCLSKKVEKEADRLVV